LISSVHRTVLGSQFTRLRSTVRLQMCVRSRPPGGLSARIRSTELPTVPNPTMATRKGCLRLEFSFAITEIEFVLAVVIPFAIDKDGAASRRLRSRRRSCFPIRRARFMGAGECNTVCTDPPCQAILRSPSLSCSNLSGACAGEELRVQVAHGLGNIGLRDHEADVNFRCALGNHADVYVSLCNC